jgi:hypothetical protein
MGKTPVVICLLLAFGYQSSEAGQFVSYKVCHGEKREVCDRHPEFDHFEGCTNSTSGEQGEAKRQYFCERFCYSRKARIVCRGASAIRVGCRT